MFGKALKSEIWALLERQTQRCSGRSEDEDGFCHTVPHVPHTVPQVCPGAAAVSVLSRAAGAAPRPACSPAAGCALCQDAGDELVEALRVLLGIHRGDLGPGLRRDSGSEGGGVREGSGKGQRGREGPGAQPLCWGGSTAKGKPSRYGEISRKNDFSSSCTSSQGTVNLHGSQV